MKRTLRPYTLVLLIAGIVSGLSGCYYDNEEELYPMPEEACGQEVSYAADVENIIQTNCATPGCHVPGTGRAPLVTAQDVIQAVNDRELDDRVESGSMPPSGALPREQINTISCWIEQGAINN